jgi:glutamyl-tRNA reductase
MPFVTVGVEHQTAPLSIRERATLEEEDIEQASRRLAASSSIAEVAILSTCNRTELYLFADDVGVAVEEASGCLAAGDPSIRSYLQVWHDMDAAEHLFRVASGLESQVLGEREILAQVRDALQMAERLGTIGTNLHTLFRSAISCARQARAGSSLGRINRSVGGEAVRALERWLGGLAGKTVLLIGGGAISAAVGDALRGKGLAALYIANRTAAVAVDLATRYGGRPATLADIARLVPRVDAIVSATSARHYVLTLEDIAGATPETMAALERRATPLQIVDLAIPRDVDPALGDVEGVVLHDLESILPPGAEGVWNDDLRAMEGVIAAEVQEFMAWYLTRRAVPIIANLRSHVEAVQRQELKRVSGQLRHLSEQERAAVESLTQRLIDKMFHHLVVRLRLAAQTDPKLVEAAEFFFLHGEGGLFEHAAESSENTPSTPTGP